MLSQRIVRAVESGIDPARMLCATFTNRAAFEMRARVEAQCQEAAMPEVGNLHHFCFRFLCSVKRLSPTRHILDECEQLSFVKEVVDVLRNEVWGAVLRYCQSAAKESSLKAEAMACLADGLYCRSPELRIRTAQVLFDLGDVRWLEAVKGTAADFERLGKIDAPTHEETIRALIAAADSCGASHYAKKLRNLIFLRAQRRVCVKMG